MRHRATMRLKIYPKDITLDHFDREVLLRALEQRAESITRTLARKRASNYAVLDKVKAEIDTLRAELDRIDTIYNMLKVQQETQP